MQIFKYMFLGVKKLKVQSKAKLLKFSKYESDK